MYLHECPEHFRVLSDEVLHVHLVSLVSGESCPQHKKLLRCQLLCMLHNKCILMISRILKGLLECLIWSAYPVHSCRGSPCLCVGNQSREHSYSCTHSTLHIYTIKNNHVRIRNTHYHVLQIQYSM